MWNKMTPKLSNRSWLLNMNFVLCGINYLLFFSQHPYNQLNFWEAVWHFVSKESLLLL